MHPQTVHAQNICVLFVDTVIIILIKIFFSSRIQDTFLALLPIKEVRAEDLYKEITNFFSLKKIPYAPDGANVMVGKHN
ncbi:unnamed protein product [Acanthoscelides obtectus]|uniref:Uncharacterized protein n=1 Tax=Acanthoscelides obtectus TaxID=200917 RepID=A0A9P0LNF5_ACAOB|nr:unnamed protein product [Acanthoscelides obtectus]CAK1641024.1 hypothetical protein AOBTE_LOCUS12090 [Acanthoscelides obtectus]